MSIEALNWAWQQSCPNPTAKLVLMALADHSNSDGECWPSMKRIAELSGISPRQVSTHITDLERLGLVTKGNRRRWEGQLRGWEYRLDLRKHTTSGSTLPVASGSTASSPAEAGFRSEPSENRKEEPIAATPPKTYAKNKDELFEAVAEACGIDWKTLTQSGRGPLNRAVKELRDIGVTADQVGGRAAAYKKQYPEAALTPMALTKHWAALAPQTKTYRESIWETYDPPERYYG